MLVYIRESRVLPLGLKYFVLFSSHPQVSAGQGGQEAVAGLLQSLVGQESQQHQGIAHQGQQDQQTKDAA